MLQQIQFHICENEDKQTEIEHALAPKISENYRESLGAFERYIPTLAKIAKDVDSQVFTLLCNKHSELNIINFKSGQAVYGMHPKKEVSEHLNQYLSLTQPIELPTVDYKKERAIVCLGLGIGYHLELLVNEKNFKHIVVYEPNIDFFSCSLSTLNWKRILRIAKEKGVALYLQIGSNASNFVKDIQELMSHTDVGDLTIYKHFHLPIFDSLEKQLSSHHWHEIEKWYPKERTASLSESYSPMWSFLQVDTEFSERFLNIERKTKNLAVLRKFFPDLYEEFADYEPHYWSPIANSSDEVSLYNKSTKAILSLSPLNDAKEGFEAFSKKPNKDGLLLSYTGKKLKGYMHYQLVGASEKILKDVAEVKSELPSKIKSLIMFGLGDGYSMELMLGQHEIGMLFICEPNKDFFHASLYSLDWEKIISQFDDGKKRLYLNIGDDGTNLTNDLLMQFQSVGPYVLANTFFYQSYVNERLADAVAHLREQLLVIIAMGDFFDNAKYGIAHTHWVLKKQIPFLLKKSERRFPASTLDVPVFIVGNGPSLDNLLDMLKLESDRAIIISCGTSLQALHKSGITPDFHAEIETNRSTFDWLTRINDQAYLKNITLLSCNGIHPDTVELFDSVLLAFKQGEASTVCLTELNKKHPFALLDFAYPTVTNFAANLATEIGFKQIYLVGTDMGFVSDTYHHSKSSGYYDGNGNELYSYAKNHSMSLVVPGNFKSWVKTKYEFKVSKGVLEQIFDKSNAEIYNLNDGARIKGAKPLYPDLVLITSSKEDKERAKESLIGKAFSSEFNDEYLSVYQKRYRQDSLIEELRSLSFLISEAFTSPSDIENLVDKQRELIVSSFLRKKSLLFYYLNGTLNYVNSAFSKLLNISDQATMVSLANQALTNWQQFIEDMRLIIENDQYGFDNISSYVEVRRKVTLAQKWSDTPIHVNHKNFDKTLKTDLLAFAERNQERPSRTVIMNWLDNNNTLKIVDTNTCNIVLGFNFEDFQEPIKGLYVIAHGDYKNESCSFQCNPFALMNLSLIALMSSLEDAIFIPRFVEHPLFSDTNLSDLEEWSKAFNCYSGPDFILLTNNPIVGENLILPTGDRLSYLPSVKPSNLKTSTISLDDYQKKVNKLNLALQCNWATKKHH